MMTFRLIGGGKALLCKGISDVAAEKLVNACNAQGIDTNAKLRLALADDAKLLALVRLYFQDALQIVDAGSKTENP